MTERRAEALSYTTAAVILVGSGMYLPSQILNWIVGPAIIVITVSALTSLLTRGNRP